MRTAFAQIDEIGLGTAVGIVGALYIWLPTTWLLVRGLQGSVSDLQLLSQYFIGYTVSWSGAFVGLLYGSALGFIIGWLVAFLRNKFLRLYLYLIKLMEEVRSLEEP